MLFQNLCSQGDTEESPSISQQNIFLIDIFFNIFPSVGQSKGKKKTSKEDWKEAQKKVNSYVYEWQAYRWM